MLQIYPYDPPDVDWSNSNANSRVFITDYKSSNWIECGKIPELRDINLLILNIVPNAVPIRMKTIRFIADDVG